LSNSHIIPINPDDTYRLSFDIKFAETDGSSSFYIALHPYDSDKKFISINTTLKSVSNVTDTTLAAAVKNGDTTVTLTDASKWYNSTVAYRKYLGICNNLAWGYNRCAGNLRYSSISGNVLTLASSWQLGSFAAGTKVSNFTDGNTYYYPYQVGHAGLPKEWKSISVTFKGLNVRFSTAYVYFNTLGYGHTYSMRNIKLENISRIQINSENTDTTANFNKSGIVYCPSFGELGRNIRYIKDSINGSTANTSNHWVEIKALDPQGVNIAYNKNVKLGSGSYTKNYITDGNTASNPYTGGSSPVIVDLGFVTKISELQIWHYWADGRTYHNNVVSVSEDGTNWDIVYQGEHPETSKGFSIKLKPKTSNIYNTGFLEANKYVEY